MNGLKAVVSGDEAAALEEAESIGQIALELRGDSLSNNFLPDWEL